MSVSDMMSGLLFIFIIALTAFIISFQAARDQAKAALNEATDARAQRSSMLKEIETTLSDKYGIQVTIDADHGILRIPNRTVSFPLSRARLTPIELEKLRHVADVMADVVSCYAAGKHVPKRCDQAKKGELDAALIEGHTDNMPVAAHARFKDNLELSTARAAYTYRNMVDFEHILGELVNRDGQPIFSVSGYGQKRPVVPHATPTPDPRNRRIDIRFIMAPPSGSEEDNPVVHDLQQAGVSQ